MISEFGQGVLTALVATALAALIFVGLIKPYGSLNTGEYPMEPKLPQEIYIYFICHEDVLLGPDLRHFYSLGDAEQFVLGMFNSDNHYVAAYIEIYKVHPDRDWETAPNGSGIPRPLAIQRRLTAYGYHVERSEYSEAEALKIEENPVWEWHDGLKIWTPRRETVTL